MEIQKIKKHEKYSIIVLISIVVFTYLIYNVFTPLYYHFTMGSSFPLSNLYNQNWSYSIGTNIFALSALPMFIGIQMFYFIIAGKSSTPLFPGVIFFIASWISILMMTKFTNGIHKWKRFLFIYLTATQLSSLILVYWTGFGA